MCWKNKLYQTVRSVFIFTGPTQSLLVKGKDWCFSLWLQQKTSAQSKASIYNIYIHLIHCGLVKRNRSGSTLAQAMACCLTAPSHYLNQSWFIINGVLWHSHESIFTGNTHDMNLSDEFNKSDIKCWNTLGFLDQYTCRCLRLWSSPDREVD